MASHTSSLRSHTLLTCFDRLQGKGGANVRLSPHQRNAPRPLVVAGVAGVAGYVSACSEVDTAHCFAREPRTLVA
jgi:hypothetical protein